MIRLTLLAAFTALPAQAFTASNDMRVQPTGEAAFTVPYNGNSSPEAFWCAAGDYVVSGLGQRADTLIYRASAVPRHSGEGIDFSLQLGAGSGKTGLVLLGGDNGAITAALAQGFCTKFDRR